MDNGGIWPGDESYFQNIRETALQDTIEQLTKELAEARAEIERLALELENKQYTITCASEENQQLKESLAEALAEIERLKAFIDQRGRKLLKCLGQKCDKDKLIEQMREIIEAVAGIAGKDWFWGQLALGELLDGKPGPHCEWALKSKADYEAALAAERGE